MAQGRHLPGDLLQRMGEVLDDDDRLAPASLQLVLELAGGVERVDVDHRVAGARDPEHGDRDTAGSWASSARRGRRGELQLTLQISGKLPDNTSSSR